MNTFALYYVFNLLDQSLRPEYETLTTKEYWLKEPDVKQIFGADHKFLTQTYKSVWYFGASLSLISRGRSVAITGAKPWMIASG